MSGCGDTDAQGVGFARQIFRILESGAAQFYGDLRSSLFHHIVYAYQFCAGNFRPDPRMNASQMSTTNDSDFHDAPFVLQRVVLHCPLSTAFPQRLLCTMIHP